MSFIVVDKPKNYSYKTINDMLNTVSKAYTDDIEMYMLLKKENICVDLVYLNIKNGYFINSCSQIVDAIDVVVPRIDTPHKLSMLEVLNTEYNILS